MDQPTPKLTGPETTPAFTLTESQLRKLIREEVQTALTESTNPGPLLAPEELAEQLKVPVSWVYEQSRQGNIPTVRVGRYIRFRLQEVVDSQKKT
jgi:excisionase family DNA binding protein